MLDDIISDGVYMYMYILFFEKKIVIVEQHTVSNELIMSR